MITDQLAQAPSVHPETSLESAHDNQVAATDTIENAWDLDAPTDYVDLLDRPLCPRCEANTYEHDEEFKASVCETCGLWVEDSA